MVSSAIVSDLLSRFKDHASSSALPITRLMDKIRPEQPTSSTSRPGPSCSNSRLPIQPPLLNLGPVWQSTGTSRLLALPQAAGRPPTSFEFRPGSKSPNSRRAIRPDLTDSATPWRFKEISPWSAHHMQPTPQFPEEPSMVSILRRVSKFSGSPIPLLRKRIFLESAWRSPATSLWSVFPERAAAPPIKESFTAMKQRLALKGCESLRRKFDRKISVHRSSPPDRP